MSVSDLNIRIGVVYRDFDREMKRVENRLSQTADRFGSIGNAMSASLTLPIIGIGAAAISAAGDFESLDKALKVTMTDAGYSIGQATKELAELQRISLAPGIDMEQAVKGSLRLQAVGFSAEKARGVLVELANALASSGGSAEQLDGVTRQFAQMSAKGKVMQEDLTIIMENMPSLAKVLMDTFGTTNAEAIRNMGVNAEEFINKITEGLSKTTRVQGGIKNAINNAQVAFKQFFATIGDGINEAYNLDTVGTSINEKLQRMADAFRNLDPETKKSIFNFALFVAAVGPAVKIVQGFYGAASLAVTGIRLFADNIKNLSSFALNAYDALGKMSSNMKLLIAGGVVAGILAVSLAYSALSDKINKAFEAQNLFAEASKEVNTQSAAEIVTLNNLFGVLKSDIATRDEKQRAIKKLNDTYPEMLGNIDLEKASVSDLTNLQNSLTKSIINRIATEKRAKLLDEQGTKVVEARLKLADIEARGVRAFAGEMKANRLEFWGLADGEVSDEVARLKEEIRQAESTANQLDKQFNSVFGTISNGADDSAAKMYELRDSEIDVEAINKKIAAAWGGKNKAADEGTAVVDKGTKANDKYKEVLKDLNTELAKARLLGSDITFEQQVEGIEEAITKLLNAGFSPNDQRVQDLINTMRALRGEALQDVPTIQSPQLPTSVTSDGSFKGDQKVKGVKDEVIATAHAYDELGDSTREWMATMNLSNGQAEAITAGLYSMRDASQEAFSGVANSLMGVEGAYVSVGAAALVAAMQMVKAALAATLAKAIQESVTKSGHPLLGVALAGVAVGGINALFGRIQQSVSKVPKFAKGAIVYGPTMAMVGDNKGASVNPEVIAPLDRLQAIMGSGSGQNIVVTGRLSGRDILLSNEKTAREMRRTR